MTDNYDPIADAWASYGAAQDALRERHEAIMAAGAKRIAYIGDAVLIEGDCLAVLPALGRVDAAITDPPYGISDAPLKLQGKTAKRRGGDNDWHPESDWDKSLNPAWGAVCDLADTVAWFGQWRKREEVAGFMRHPLRTEIVWAKDCHMGPPSPVAPRDERIWVFAAEGIKPATFETSVWDQPVIPTWSFKHHKNEKPVALMARLIRWTGAQSICDPFMGSGTTGVAAIQLGRKFIGIELDPGYFDIACKRISEAWAQPRLFAEPKAKPEPAPTLFDGESA